MRCRRRFARHEDTRAQTIDLVFDGVGDSIGGSDGACRTPSHGALSCTERDERATRKLDRIETHILVGDDAHLRLQAASHGPTQTRKERGVGRHVEAGRFKGLDIDLRRRTPTAGARQVGHARAVQVHPRATFDVGRSLCRVGAGGRCQRRTHQKAVEQDASAFRLWIVRAAAGAVAGAVAASVVAAVDAIITAKVERMYDGQRTIAVGPRRVDQPRVVIAAAPQREHISCSTCAVARHHRFVHYSARRGTCELMPGMCARAVSFSFSFPLLAGFCALSFLLFLCFLVPLFFGALPRVSFSFFLFLKTWPC